MGTGEAEEMGKGSSRSFFDYRKSGGDLKYVKLGVVSDLESFGVEGGTHICIQDGQNKL
jgi:hypothetical protein